MNEIRGWTNEEIICVVAYTWAEKEYEHEWFQGWDWTDMAHAAKDFASWCHDHPNILPTIAVENFFDGMMAEAEGRGSWNMYLNQM